MPLISRPAKLPPDLCAGLVLTTSVSNGAKKSTWSFASYSVHPMDGEGFGAIALKDYAEGERILSEKPLATWTVADRSKMQHDAATKLLAIIASLDSVQREAYFSLCQLPDGDVAGLPYSQESTFAIWMTNAYPTTHASDGHGEGDGQAVFEQISRLNHSCVQCNAILTWNAKLGAMTCHAARPIRKGESLTVCYWFDDGWRGLRRAERHERLLERFGFECACATCRLSGTALEKSEERQRRIRELSGRLTQSGAGTARASSERISESVAELLQTLEDEGAPAVWGKRAMLAARAAAAKAGEMAMARVWGERAMECVRIGAGADSPEYETAIKHLR